MRKILALVLALCMVFALAACGSETAETSDAPASEAPVSEAPASDTPESEAP
jgi:outer membrane lipopolysaccharide assembly protein LptE/RlpB